MFNQKILFEPRCEKKEFLACAPTNVHSLNRAFVVHEETASLTMQYATN